MFTMELLIVYVCDSISDRIGDGICDGVGVGNVLLRLEIDVMIIVCSVTVVSYGYKSNGKATNL